MKRYLLMLAAALWIASSSDAQISLDGVSLQGVSISGGGGGGGQTFTEDCNDISEWGKFAESGADVTSSAGICDFDTTTGFADLNLQSSSNTDSVDNWCLVKIDATTLGTSKQGCIFRAQGSPGEHYRVGWDNNADNWYFTSANNDFTGDVNVAGVTHCGCTYSAVDDLDWFGIHLHGTSTSHVLTYHDFSTTPPSTNDPDDGDWTSAVVCTCDSSEIDAVFSGSNYIDTAGECGAHFQSTNPSQDTPDYDEFRCGDNP